MPATRATRHTHAKHPQQLNVPPSDPDIIILSSDDEDSQPRRPVPRKKPVRRSPRFGTKAATPDVVEISSSDEGSSLNVPHRTITSLRQQLKDAREEAAQLREAKDQAEDNEVCIENLRKEVALLKAEAALRNETDAKSNDVITNLDDYLCCEICTLKMWTPYALACGHSFCQTCLHDWFSTTLATQKAAHPQLYATLQVYREELHAANVAAAVRRQLQAQIDALKHQLPAPAYTCPTCRAPATAHPIEVFALKHVVRVVAGAIGESSPKKPPPARGAAARAMLEGPWDAFFDS